MKILVVEDDLELNNTMCQYLEIKSFDTVCAKDGLEAIDLIEERAAHLYIIDINIPQINGLDLVSHIRKTDLETPIVIITASPEIENFTVAFENGCSEFIKKPFHLKELDIRIQNLLSIKEENVVVLGKGLKYDLKEEVFVYGKETIDLRPKEKRLCALMIKNINHVVSNEKIQDYVWEGEIRESYPLRQLLSNLRKKLPFELIQNKTKVGYLINSPKDKRLSSATHDNKDVNYSA